MKCPYCFKELATQKTVTAIRGIVCCNACATTHFSAKAIQDLAERVRPDDIGIEPEV